MSNPLATWSGKKARRKLQSTLVLFFVALVLPIGGLILWSNQQLEDESFLALRMDSEKLVDAIDEKVHQLILPEEQRPFDEYSFFSVTQNALLQEKGVRYSPLSEIPNKSPLPGLVGYFQINPDQSIQTPLLPEITPHPDELKNLGIGRGEFEKRKALQASIEEIIGSISSGSDKETTIVGAADTKDSPAKRENELELAIADSAPQKGVVIDKLFQGSKKKVSDLNLDESLSQRSEAKNDRGVSSSLLGTLKADGYARVARKQSYTLPLQDSERPAQEAKVASGASAPAPATGQKLDLTSLAKKIVTFEGEIDPFQVSVVENQKLLFYRRIWREKTRYLQGFVVEEARFIKELFDIPFSESSAGSVGTLRLAFNGAIIHQSGVLPKSEKLEKLIYRRALHAPLDKFEVVLSASALPLSESGMLIRALSGAILVILCVGMGLIYQVAKTQIALSEKKSDFVSAVSHELKTPLTSIRMYAEMLKSGWIKDKEKERSYYDFILSESERLSRLIGNVLHLSGIGSGGNALALTVKTPLEVLSFVESKVRSQIESAGFTLTLKVPSELGDTAIRIEDDSITRIFINLVDNALKFAKSAVRKEIEIGLRVEGERVTFFVRDFGPGVPTAQQRKIFELFYRAESELTRTTPGTGIGLALVRELATKLGARVDVTNCAPGAEFRVIFS